MPVSSGQKPLSEINTHSRDARIEFCEDEHIYILDGIYTFPRSVSRLVGNSFDEFDAPAVAKRSLKKWREDPDSKYHALIAACEEELPGVSPATLICAAWSANGAHKSELGRMMHLSIELTLNGTPIPDSEVVVVDSNANERAPQVFAELCAEGGAAGLRVEEARAVLDLALAGDLKADARVKVTLPPAPLNDPEMLAWARWRASSGADLEPMRTEWSIYSTKHQIAGQIDAVFRRISTGEIVLIDWKRVAGLERAPLRSERDPEAARERFLKFGKAPLEDLPDTKYWHYAVQVNVYAHLLRTLYKVDVAEMRLVQVHPSLPSPGFAEHRIARIAPATIEALLNRPFKKSHH